MKATAAGLLLLSVFAAGQAQAEGARIRLDCTPEPAACGAECDPLAITLQPGGTDAAGQGEYRITVNDAAPVTARGAGFTGPFGWTGAKGLRLLVLKDETHALWLTATGAEGDTALAPELGDHAAAALPPGTDPNDLRGRIVPLTCEITG